MSNELVGILFALGTATAFGLGSTIARLGLVGTPVLTGTIISMLAGSALLMAVASPSYYRTLGAIDHSGWAWIVFTASINYPIGRVLLFQSMRRIGVARGNTIVSASPVISAVMAVIWFEEKLTPGIAIGMAACVAGAAVVAWVAREAPQKGDDADAYSSQVAKGLAAALGAMLAYGSVAVLIKKLVTDITEPLTAASLVFGIGASIVGLMSLPRLRRDLPAFTFRRTWLLVLGGTTMSVGILLFYTAVSKAPIVAVAPIVALSPLISIGAAQIIARRLETVDKRIWAGAVSVVSGVALIGISL